MKRVLLAIALLIRSAGVSAETTLEDIIASLGDSGCLSAAISYEVLLPSAADPVTYSVTLIYRPTSNDPLSPCDYLIDWSLPRGQKTATGFNAYFDGNHFRYRDTKMQEYHFADDSIPFLGNRGGVQRMAQFADLLPPMMAETLSAMVADTTYQMEWNPGTLTLSGRQRIKGYDSMTFDYRFIPNSRLPEKIVFEYNPASISEQTVTVRYTWLRPEGCSIDEATLIDRYPEAFERFRTSNFKIENLSGTELPSFTAVTPTRERYAYQQGDALASPTIMVFLDPAVASSPTTVNDIRSAVASLPKAANVLYTFDRATIDETDAIIGATAIGETILTNAVSLSRSLGVTTRPTILLIDSDGIIRDIIIGVNKDLSDVVIQKMTLID